MDMANHALAGGDRSGESVFDGTPRLVFRNSGIGRSAEAGMTVLRVGPGVRWIRIIGVDNMAGGTAAGAIVAGVVVGARKRHHRIKNERFFEPEQSGIGTQPGAESA